jgi:hypothetical protein
MANLNRIRMAGLFLILLIVTACVYPADKPSPKPELKQVFTLVATVPSNGCVGDTQVYSAIINGILVFIASGCNGISISR